MVRADERGGWRSLRRTNTYRTGRPNLGPMPNLDKIKLWLDERLPALLAEHQVPGAAVAVLADDEIIDTAAGVLSTATGRTGFTTPTISLYTPANTRSRRW